MPREPWKDSEHIHETPMLEVKPYLRAREKGIKTVLSKMHDGRVGSFFYYDTAKKRNFITFILDTSVSTYCSASYPASRLTGLNGITVLEDLRADQKRREESRHY